MPHPLPAHALAEIEAAGPEDVEAITAWWAGWAAIGDAKDDLEARWQDLIAAELRLRICRDTAGLLDVPATDCGCGGCFDRYSASRQARDDAKAAVLAAEQTFKEL